MKKIIGKIIIGIFVCTFLFSFTKGQDGNEGGDGGGNNGVTNTLAGVGMTINTECLIRGQCGMNLYELLGIRRGDTTPTVMSVIQDVILAATTFVGTIIVIALIVSGVLFAIASISGKDTKRAKTIIIDCFVGLLLVMGSYTIIRLIQFLALAGK